MSDNIQHLIEFNKPNSDLLPDLLAESIRRAVRESRLNPGEQLPSEPEFAESLGVSRSTLRDALRILVSEAPWSAGAALAPSSPPIRSAAFRTAWKACPAPAI